MLDINLFRYNPEFVRERLAHRNKSDAAKVNKVVELDKNFRAHKKRIEENKAEINSKTDEIGKLMRGGRVEEATAIREVVTKLKAKIEDYEIIKSNEETKLNAIISKLPNLLAESVPPGGEKDSIVGPVVGNIPTFDFTPKPHWELAENLELVDFVRGTKLSGSGFVLYKGSGALLERGLIQFMLDMHVIKHGYTEWSTPFFLSRESMTASAHIVKFKPEMYYDNKADLFALPTAEPALVNIHRGEILDESLLPLNYVAYSPCWRREAGAAGKETRGLQRLHQFDKVEMVKLTTAETSFDELEKMLQDAIDVVEALGLTYRVLTLAAKDVSFAMAKTYDIEVYAPGVDRWLEVSSVSNGTDFQGRRGKIRYKSKATGAKPQIAHMLNGSGTALPRVLAALLETYQLGDGTVQLPEVLAPYLRGKTLLA